MNGELKKLFKDLSLNEKPAHFKIDNKFNIPEIDQFLLGPDFNFNDEKINLFLSKSYQKMSQLCVDAFEASAGVIGFNKHFYLPLKKFYNENFEDIFISAQKNSVYDITQNHELLLQRLFVEAAFLFMKIDYNKNEKEKLKDDIDSKFIPQGESCVFVFNHPFGIVDTLIAARLTMQKRPDVKFMANSLVSKLIPEIKGLLLDLDVMVNGKGGNNSTVSGAVDYLKKGGAIIMFPDPVLPLRKPWYANKVHATQKLDFKKGLGQLMMGAPQAKISMIYLTGEFPNSKIFHGLGSFHPWIKLSMVLREFLKTKKNQSYHTYLAAAIDPDELQKTLASEAVKIKSKSMTELDMSKAMALVASKYVEKKYLDFKESVSPTSH